jgi:hypothetical protein
MTTWGGTEQTLVVTTGYRLFGQAGKVKATLRPPYNGCWPSARYDVESVRIRLTAGYALTPTDVMPAAIKQAVLLGVRQLYDIGARSAFLAGDVVFGVGSKQFAVSEGASLAVQRAMDALLQPLRIFE